MSKKILMICYYFPPLTDVGCRRSIAFAKYWKQAGWSPHVLSVSNPDKTYCSPGDDLPPPGIDVTRTPSLLNVYWFFGKLNGLCSRILSCFGIDLQHNYFYDLLCVPDFFIGWVIPGILSGLKVIKSKKIDLIYVSCSPFSAGLIGMWLKRLTGCPLVLDYRDPYGLDISRYQKGFMPKKFRRPVDRWIARRIIQACDLFTVTTEETRKLYMEQFPEVKEKIHTIYNGFDHQLLTGLKPENKFSRFTIIYTGQFYYDVEFDSFFNALGQLKKNGKINGHNFQFLFYGGEPETLQESMAAHDVMDLVHIRCRIPHAEVLKEIKRSHLQLLRIARPMISTKLFEGIVLDIPFLATIPRGEVEDIIRKYSPGSHIITDNAPQSICRCIERAMAGYPSMDIPNKVTSFLKTFSRERSSLQMLHLFDRLRPQGKR